jgi:hypothetical protein
MSKLDDAPTDDRRLRGLPFRYVAAIVVLLTLLMLPVMGFLLFTEREVSQYSTLTFESCARKAIENHEFAHAVRVCTGAFRVGIGRSDFWGKAYLLRAQAHARAQDNAAALADLDTAARLWSQAPYNATPELRNEIALFGTQFGLERLEAGDVSAALRAISDAAMGSGDPVEYLHAKAETFPEATKRALWPDGPCITVEGYGGEHPASFEAFEAGQSRKVLAARVDASGGRAGGPCEAVDLGEGGSGESIFTILVNIPVSPKPFALRAVFNEEPAGTAKLFVNYWFDFARRSASTTDAASVDLGDGWTRIEAKRDFFAERADFAKRERYDPAGGVINRIGLSFPPGPALRCRIDRIELFIPQHQAGSG